MGRMMGKFLLGLLNVSLIVTFVVTTSFAIWLNFYGSQPIDFPVARGITFWQSIAVKTVYS
jgi:hypothetical protein